MEKKRDYCKFLTVSGLLSGSTVPRLKILSKVLQSLILKCSYGHTLNCDYYCIAQ